MKCPTCKNGKITLSVETFGEEGIEEYEIDCIDCKGTGIISNAKNKQLEFQKNMWCKCEQSTGPKYYANGKHPELHKHHYRCTTCKGVVQIG